MRWSVFTTTVSQIYVALLGIALLPVYLRYLGSEAYGLVGFFALLMALTQFLDMGMSATLTRESARFRGGIVKADELLTLVSALQKVFGLLALALAVVVLSTSHSIVARWLNIASLPLGTAEHAVVVMGLTLPLRWLSSLYRGVLNGFEQLIWLSGFNTVIATVRFVAVIPLLAFISTSIVGFFWFQFLVSLLEFLVLVVTARRLLPPSPSGAPRASWLAVLRKSVAFSSTLGLATLAWLLVTQTDKLILSTTLSLAEYGHFTLAVMLASSVGLCTAPLGQAVLPRLTRLVAEHLEVETLTLYRHATHALCIIAAPLSLALALFAEPVLFAWTGNSDLARSMAPVLSLYAVGNGVLAVAAMPYLLQYAKGDLRFHTFGTVLLAALLVPSTVLAIHRWGALGAGACWLAGMTTYLFVWTPIAHRLFAPGLEWRWLLRDIFQIALPAVFIMFVAAQFLTWPVQRIPMALTLLGLVVCAVGACAAASSWARALVADSLGCVLRRLLMPAA